MAKNDSINFEIYVETKIRKEVGSLQKLKIGLYKYLPNIVKFVYFKDSELDKVISKYLEQFYTIPPYATINRPFSFFQYIHAALCGKMYEQSFLAFYDNQASYLYDLLSEEPEQQRKLETKIRNSILDVSSTLVLKPSNPAFLNFVGEVLYAAKIIPACSAEYDFCGFDVRLDNKKDADLMFRRKQDRKSIYFDNVSIHFINVLKLRCIRDISIFFQKRMLKKIEAKVSGLKRVGGKFLINGEVSEFYVAPILWNESSELINYVPFFERVHNVELNHLMMALLPRKQREGHYEFSLEMVECILDDWVNQNRYLSKKIKDERCGIQHNLCHSYTCIRYRSKNFGKK